MKRTDLTGKRFGKLVATRYSHFNYKNGAMWACVCDCGNEKTVSARNLLRENTKSCGCMKKGKRQGNYTIRITPAGHEYLAARGL